MKTILIFDLKKNYTILHFSKIFKDNKSETYKIKGNLQYFFFFTRNYHMQFLDIKKFKIFIILIMFTIYFSGYILGIS